VLAFIVTLVVSSAACTMSIDGDPEPELEDARSLGNPGRPMAEIARSGNGDLFGIDSAGDIYRYRQAARTWQLLGGWATAIAADAWNRPWVIGGGSTIWFGDTAGNWQLLPGSATSLGAGAGEVFASGWGVYRWNGSSGAWDDWGASGMKRVAVDPWGLPWGSGHDGTIWRHRGGWEQLPGGALDIAVTRTGGTAYVVGGDWQIYRSGVSEGGFYWEPTGRFGTRVTGGSNGRHYDYIDLAGNVQTAGRGRPEDEGWIYDPGSDSYWMPRPAGGCPDLGLVCHDQQLHNGCAPHIHSYLVDEVYTDSGILCIASKAYTECRDDLISCEEWEEEDPTP
jgi:hypothetical protein